MPEAVQAEFARHLGDWLRDENSGIDRHGHQLRRNYPLWKPKPSASWFDSGNYYSDRVGGGFPTVGSVFLISSVLISYSLNCMR